MRYPKFLPENGTLGFVAPSFGCNIEPYKTAFESALESFKSMGYKVNVGPNCFEGSGTGISNTPKKCGKELSDYYCSGSCDVLISCGGGELMCETMDFVDFEKIKAADPKWYLGYSDNTNFIFPLLTIADTAAIYGPCAAAFGMEPWHKSIENAFGVISGERARTNSSGVTSFLFRGYAKYESESEKDEDNPLAPYHLTSPALRRAYKSGKPVIVPEFGESGKAIYPDKKITARGRLIGGCLDVLELLSGTKYDHVQEFIDKYKDDGILWFMEACDLNPMAIRRAIWHLDRLGWFKHASGFLIGRPLCNGEIFINLDQYRAVYEPLAKYNVPILMDLDFGHIPPAVPIISGSIGEATLRGNKFSLKMYCKY